MTSTHCFIVFVPSSHAEHQKQKPNQIFAQSTKKQKNQWRQSQVNERRGRQQNNRKKKNKSIKETRCYESYTI